MWRFSQQPVDTVSTPTWYKSLRLSAVGAEEASSDAEGLTAQRRREKGDFFFFFAAVLALECT